MSTIHLHRTTTLTPEQYIAGLTDFGPGRSKLFGNSAEEYLKVHDLGPMQAAIDGQGIALARSSLLGNDLHNGVLVQLFGIVVPLPKKYFLVYPPRLVDSPKLAPFRQWLFDEVAEERRGPLTPEERKARPRKRSTAKGKRPARNHS